jgi:ParB family chromosome partitioning protein
VTKERRLGRGLEALLGRLPTQAETPQPADTAGGPPTDQPPGFPYSPDQAPAIGPYQGPIQPPSDQQPAAQGPLPSGTAATQGSQQIDVQQIDANPFQPRQDFDPAEMQSLTDSLTAHGLLQPIVVRRANDRYQLIAGERRLRAAVQAGWSDVPASIIDADDRQTAELTIVENLQRKDLNPLEKAASFRRYLETYGCTQEELAGRLKLDRSTISNLIRLLELPEAVQQALREAKITQGHARALLPLGEEREQIEFCRRIQREGLSVRQTESMVQQAISAADRGPLGVVGLDGASSRSPRVQSEHLAALEQEFRAALGTKVKITHNARGRGRLVIHFRSHEEFDRLRRQITDPGRPDTQSQAG